MFYKGSYNGNLQDAIESFNFTAITSKNTGGFINMIVYEKIPEEYLLIATKIPFLIQKTNLLTSITSNSEKINESINSKLIKKLGIELTPIQQEIPEEIKTILDEILFPLFKNYSSMFF